MDFETLLSEILQNPEVWDKKNKYFSNRIVTEKIWDSIAIAMKAPKNECKKKFKYLKDEYRKALRKVPQPTSGAEAETHVSKFKYFEMMGFLRDDSALTGDSNIKCMFEDIELQDETSMSSVFLDNIGNNDPLTSAKEIQQQSTSINRQTKRKTDMDEAYLEIEKKKLKLLEMDSDQTNNDDSGDLHFFKSLLPFVQNFSTLKKLEFRANIIRNIIEITKEEGLDLPKTN